MSTRGAFRIRDKKNVFLTFSTNHGDLHQLPLVIADFIQKGDLVKGIDFSTYDTNKVQFNGIGCFAAALIAHIKTGAGGVYIIPESEWGNGAEDFAYDIIYEENQFNWTVYRETFSSARGKKYHLVCSCCNADFLGFNFDLF